MTFAGLPVIYPDLPIRNSGFFWGGIILIFIPIVVLIVVMIKTGQGGCKVKFDIDDNSANPEFASAKIAAGGSSKKVNVKSGDDKYWIFGMWYYNRDDPANIVENRFGTNFGFNYARLPVKIGVAVLLLGLASVYVWLTVYLV